MKIHAKKKAYRAQIHGLMHAGKYWGYIHPKEDWRWVVRDHAPDNSMRRDFHPQVGKKRS